MSDYDRYKSNRDTLDLMASQLYTMADNETSESLASYLNSAASELSHLADDYTDRIKAHERLKAQLISSVASQGE
jgi:hypothetical protein